MQGVCLIFEASVVIMVPKPELLLVLMGGLGGMHQHVNGDITFASPLHTYLMT